MLKEVEKKIGTGNVGQGSQSRLYHTMASIGGAEGVLDFKEYTAE